MIALDIDGVLANTNIQMKTLLSTEFGFDEDSAEWAKTYNNVVSLDNKELESKANARAMEIYATNASLYEDAAVVEGALDAAWVIGPAAYITRRPEAHGIREATEKWLEDNEFPEAPLYFIPHGTCKSEMAKSLGITAIVEDSPKEIVSCTEGGLEVYVFLHDYNRNFSENHKSSDNWVDMLEILLKDERVSDIPAAHRLILSSRHGSKVPKHESYDEENERISARIKKFNLPSDSIGVSITLEGIVNRWLNLDGFSITYTWHRMSNADVRFFNDDAEIYLDREDANRAYFILLHNSEEWGIGSGRSLHDNLKEAFSFRWWV